MIETKTFHILKNYQDHIPCSFAHKVVCIDDRFSKSITQEKMQSTNFLKQFLKKINIVKR